MCHYHEREIENDLNQRIVDLYNRNIEANLLRLRKAEQNDWISRSEYITVLQSVLTAKTIRAQVRILNIFFDNLLCLQSH